jgi:hypothetical protein
VKVNVKYEVKYENRNKTHHVAPIMATPTLAPRLQIVVGGPSRAPINVPSTVASFNSSGISYQKVEPPKTAQAFTGQGTSKGPHMLTKAMRIQEELDALPEGECQELFGIPFFNPTPAQVQQVDLWLAASNAIASGSQVRLEDLPRSLQERLSMPPPQVEPTMLPVKKVRKR